MYFIYLYCDEKYDRSNTVQYGYWSGKSYIHDEDTFPGTADNSNMKKRKTYKTLNRAIKGGYIAIEKYTCCCGFDVEDENGNIIYKSFEDERKNDFIYGKTNNTILKTKDKLNEPTSDRMLQIQEQSELCGKFLDWFLCKYAVFERRQKRESSFVNPDGVSDYINKEGLIAEFFEEILYS